MIIKVIKAIVKSYREDQERIKQAQQMRAKEILQEVKPVFPHRKPGCRGKLEAKYYCNLIGVYSSWYEVRCPECGVSITKDHDIYWGGPH